MPKQVSIYDSGSVERARTTLEYDNYATDTNHASLTPRANISGLCALVLSPTSCDNSNPPGQVKRGNATGTTRYLLLNGSVTGSVSAYQQYDIAGNVVKVIDARGFVTTLEYSDRYGAPDTEAQSNTTTPELGGLTSYAFATRITNPAGHITFAQFDYYLGRPVNGEDANGVVASGFYNDALDRPTKVIRGVNKTEASQTTFSYDDFNRVVTTKSDQDYFNDQTPLESQVRYDGLGRTVRTLTYENQDVNNPWLTADTQYDSMGRAWQQSNPYRSTGYTSLVNPSGLWTTTAFDSLGRVLTVTTADSAFVTTSYSGNTVTVIDQANKKRKSVTDALGRLKAVYEDPTPGLNYLTSYGYDGLDNLTTVTQGVQTRTFVYDSLKRLTSATNPESGTINYIYDNNGNLLIRTDARGVSSHYEYDVLNRVTRRWYNGRNLLTDMVNNSPALPAGVGATDEVKYFYDSSTLPAGAPPAFDRGYATGRLVAATYGGGSSGTYLGYDGLGRTLRSIQQTGGINYQTSATYNAAGGVLTQSYPSTRVVTNTYDAAGRTASVAGTLSDGTNHRPR